MKKEIKKQLLKPFLFPLAVLIVAWEEFIYKPIQFISAYIEKNKIIHKISDKIRNSNPYIALGILICGGLPLIPFKMAGLYLVGHGYAVLGIGTFGLAKVVGGAISVQLFNLTEPAIRKISFVNTALNWTFDKKDKIKKILTDSEHYQSIQHNIQQFKKDVKELILDNSFVKTIKQKISNKSAPKLKPISKEITEITITEKITAKVEDMSHTVSLMIDETITISSHSNENILDENSSKIKVNEENIIKSDSLIIIEDSKNEDKEKKETKKRIRI